MSVCEECWRQGGSTAEGYMRELDKHDHGDCTWVEQDSGEYWSTRCGHAYTIIDGAPYQNEFSFCCYCGKILRQLRTEDQPNDK